MKAVKLPPFVTREVKEYLTALGGRWNGIPFGTPGFGWEVPEEVYDQVAKHLHEVDKRQDAKIASSIIRDLGNGKDR